MYTFITKHQYKCMTSLHYNSVRYNSVRYNSVRYNSNNTDLSLTRMLT